jgi:flagellar protein FlaF
VPTDLRAKLVSISIWVERHTASVLTGKDDVQELIDVNQMVIAGLSGQATSE